MVPGRLTMSELHEDKWDALVKIVAAFEAKEAIHNDDNNDDCQAIIGRQVQM